MPKTSSNVALDPSYALAHRMLGVLLATDGRHEEARSCLGRARELEPLQPMMWALSAHVALLARDHSVGLEFARQATVVGPAFWIGFFQLAWAYERLGEIELALDALQRAEASAGGNSKMISLLQHAYNVRDVHLIWLPMDPKWDPLRNQASFVRLLERCAFRKSPGAIVTPRWP